MAIDSWAKRLGFVAIPGVTSLPPPDGGFDGRDRRQINDCIALVEGKFNPFFFWRQEHVSSSSGNLHADGRAGSTPFHKEKVAGAAWQAERDIPERG